MIRLCCKCHRYAGLLSSLRSTALNVTYKNDRKCSSKSRGRNVFTDHSKKELPTSYHPSYVEDSVKTFWRETFPLKADGYSNKNSEIFSMLLPPPNVTGTLHLGHVLTVTIQDVLARWHRMQGKSVLWIPGLDHAGIATQTTFEKKLLKEKGLTRHDLGKVVFKEELLKWKEEKSNAIVQQLKRIGATLDWSMEYFTLDPKLSYAVNEAFIRLYDAGIIYRTNALVNWSCSLQSTISDIEVEHKQIESRVALKIPGYSDPVEFGTLTSFAYKVHGSEHEIVVSTSRLETMLGDTAVAVHPSDKRYEHLHGAKLIHPFREDTIPVICDNSVDPTFGTGAVKVTPAHSHIDLEIGKRNYLKSVSVINEDGTLNENCGSFAGLKRYDARKRVRDTLEQLGQYRGEQSHAMMLPMCSRSGDVVEFLLKPQWFIKSQAMVSEAVRAVENKELHIVPKSYESVWFNWLKESRDWCISRQLWWGHQIPAYKCSVSEVGKTAWVAARNIEEAKEKAAKQLNLSSEQIEYMHIVQDEDVLDTWFSSALLPFSALDWPLMTEKSERFYPLNLMETGHDILFFWVARMVMLGTTLTGKLPFKKVLLHGIVCDAQGRKMSKSLGNVIEPEHVIEGISVSDLKQDIMKRFETGVLSTEEMMKAVEMQKKIFPNGIPECGSDALRFTLCSQNVSSNYVSFDLVACHKNRNFCNKIWQACRYIEKCYADVYITGKLAESGPLNKMDKWILSRVAKLVSEVDNALVSDSFHTAVYYLKNFIYFEFCDIYVEATKPIIKACNASSVTSVETLVRCMEVALRALHPFMPFVTEYLYHYLPPINEVPLAEAIAFASFPKQEQWIAHQNEEIENEMKDVFAVVDAIRYLRSNHNIVKADKPNVYIQCTTVEEQNLHNEHCQLISTLTGVLTSQVVSGIPENVEGVLVNKSLSDTCSVHIASTKKNDGNVENKHLDSTKKNDRNVENKLKKYQSLMKTLEKLRKRTSHPGYSSGAPEHVQKKNSQKMALLLEEIKKLEQCEETRK